jgi:hypothetical protein
MARWRCPGGAAKALTETAKFLKDQGRIESMASDYSKSVTPEFVQKAMKRWAIPVHESSANASRASRGRR